MCSELQPEQLPPVRQNSSGLAIEGSKVGDIPVLGGEAPSDPHFVQAMNALAEFRRERGE